MVRRSRAAARPVYELGADGRYVMALDASEGQHTLPDCTGLVLDLDKLWAHVDSLAAP